MTIYKKGAEHESVLNIANAKAEDLYKNGEN